MLIFASQLVTSPFEIAHQTMCNNVVHVNYICWQAAPSINKKENPNMYANTHKNQSISSDKSTLLWSMYACTTIGYLPVPFSFLLFVEPENPVSFEWNSSSSSSFRCHRSCQQWIGLWLQSIWAGAFFKGFASRGNGMNDLEGWFLNLKCWFFICFVNFF